MPLPGKHRPRHDLTWCHGLVNSDKRAVCNKLGNDMAEEKFSRDEMLTNIGGTNGRNNNLASNVGCCYSTVFNYKNRYPDIGERMRNENIASVYKSNQYGCLKEILSLGFFNMSHFARLIGVSRQAINQKVHGGYKFKEEHEKAIVKELLKLRLALNKWYDKHNKGVSSRAG